MVNSPDDVVDFDAALDRLLDGGEWHLRQSDETGGERLLATVVGRPRAASCGVLGCWRHGDLVRVRSTETGWSRTACLRHAWGALARIRP